MCEENAYSDVKMPQYTLKFQLLHDKMAKKSCILSTPFSLQTAGAYSKGRNNTLTVSLFGNEICQLSARIVSYC